MIRDLEDMMNNGKNHCKESNSCKGGSCEGCLLSGIEEPKLGEECGVFGMYDLHCSTEVRKAAV